MKTEAYACYNMNLKEREESSSGGVYSLLAKIVIQNGGVVFAACYDDNLNVIHAKIDKLEDIPKTRGSKYVFSNIGDTFFQIKELISAGQQVMFVGTPCQCAGALKMAENFRDKLICVDFVCHGVPEQKTWKLYIESLKKRNIVIKSLNMRCKETGWSHYNYCWKFICADGSEIIQKQSENPYMRGFTKDFYLKKSCYECKFKGYERKTDLTLGDFWGIWDIEPDMDDNKGTSLILIHTENGKKIFELISSSVKKISVTKEEAIKFNSSILVSAAKPQQYEIFKKAMEDNKDFIDTIALMTKRNLISDIKYKLKNRFVLCKKRRK